MSAARWPLLLVVAAGCTSTVPDELVGVPITSAFVDGVGLGGLQMIVGGWGGTGELHARTARGDELVVPVDLTGGSVGMLMEFALSGGGRLDLDLPPEPVDGEDLFGTYRGLREAGVLIVGPVGVHLENDAGVRIDETRLAFGMAISVSWG